MRILDILKARAGLLTFVALGAGVFAYEWHEVKSTELVSTAEAKPKPSGPAVVLAEGRLVTYPDAEATLGAELGGKVVKLFVHERDSVRAGDPIAEIDAREERAALAEARARAKEVEADIDFFSSEKRRSQQLLEQNVLARSAFDKTKHDADGATQRRASLLAAVARLQTEVDKAIVKSPLGGTVTSRWVTMGEFVATGAPLVTIADLDRVRIEAEVGEFDAGKVAVGAKVIVRAEGYAGTYRGTIEELPDRVVPRQMKPLDPARPVDTRVLLAKVRLDEQVPFRLGQRVEVEIRH